LDEAIRAAHFSDTSAHLANGVATSLRLLAESVQDGGARSLLVCPGSRRRALATSTTISLPSVPLGLTGNRLAFRFSDAVAAKVRKWAPDIIHVHTVGPVGLWGILLAHRLDLPLVQTYWTDLHRYADAYRIPDYALKVFVNIVARSLRKPVSTSGLGRADLVTAACSMLLDESDLVIAPTPAPFLRNNFAPSRPIEYLPAPSDLAFTGTNECQRMEFRRRWDIPAHAPVIIFVGRLHVEKSIDILLSAFGHLLTNLPSAILLLVGTPVWPRRLASQMRASRVSSKAICTGALTGRELAAAYCASDVFAFPSITDTQGLVLHEAALAGVPIVMSDNILHSCHPLRDGMLLTGNSHAAFSEGILRILTLRSFSDSLSSLAHRMAVTYTRRTYGLLISSVYEKTISINTARRSLERNS
jgi:1,2-diacylglycerol 3-alpha-glucosyltransferase